MNDSYRLPKDEVTATVALKGTAPEQMHLFLLPASSSHPGHERPSDLLEDEAAFVPMRSSKGDVQMIHKSAIAWLTIASELEMFGRTEVEVSIEEREQVRVEVHLDDDRSIKGHVHLSLPEAHQRLQDFLNRAHRFFEVYDEDVIHFVNRDRVVRVVPID